MKAWKPSCSASFTCSRKRALFSSPSEQTDTLMDQASIGNSKHDWFVVRSVGEGALFAAVPTRTASVDATFRVGRRMRRGASIEVPQPPLPTLRRRIDCPAFPLLFCVMQSAIGRIGFCPFARIGTVDAFGEVGADAKIDRHIDDPGPAAGDRLAQRRSERLWVLDAHALRPIGMGEFHVIWIVALAGVLARKGAPG